MSCYTRIPVGRVYPSPVSKFGRAIADGDIYIAPPEEVEKALRKHGRTFLKGLLSDLVCIIDELTWDLEAVSDPERAARVREAITRLRAALKLTEERLARLEKRDRREGPKPLH